MLHGPSTIPNSLDHHRRGSSSLNVLSWPSRMVTELTYWLPGSWRFTVIHVWLWSSGAQNSTGECQQILCRMPFPRVLEFSLKREKDVRTEATADSSTKACHKYEIAHNRIIPGRVQQYDSVIFQDDLDDFHQNSSKISKSFAETYLFKSQHSLRHSGTKETCLQDERRSSSPCKKRGSTEKASAFASC